MMRPEDCQLFLRNEVIVPQDALERFQLQQLPHHGIFLHFLVSLRSELLFSGFCNFSLDAISRHEWFDSGDAHVNPPNRRVAVVY